MKSSDEIIQAHMTEDGLDLPAVLEELKAGIRPMPVKGVDDILNMVALIDAHLSWAVTWVADLVLEMLGATDNLPLGAEAEKQNVRLAFEFDRMKRLYDLVYEANKPKLVVPNS